MLKAGIYRSKTPTLAIEEHGGGKIEYYVFWYLCFYLPKPNVGFYGDTSPDYVQPYIQNRIDLKGEITQLTENKISFYIYNTAKGKNINFIGTIENNNLHLTYRHEHKPNELHEDVFEYFWDGVSP